MKKQYHGRFAAVFYSMIIAGCTGDTPAGEIARRLVDSNNVAAPAACEVASAMRPLPMTVKETSGLARSLSDPSLFWTHNDAGNQPVIFSVSSDGSLRSRARVTGASLDDWEDIASAPCGDAKCLFIGDIGDNSGNRSSITIYRVTEPAAGATVTSPATAVRARYPGGSRDAEAMFVLSGRTYIVTKGRKEPIELYRVPASGSGVLVMEKVRDLWREPKSNDDRVTSASASPGGRWVAIRTYRRLYIFDAAALTRAGGSVSPIEMDLSPVGEPAGEGVAIADDGTVWLSSEASGKRPPGIASLKCSLAAR